jgi:hypothetical protein
MAMFGRVFAELLIPQPTTVFPKGGTDGLQYDVSCGCIYHYWNSYIVLLNGGLKSASVTIDD